MRTVTAILVLLLAADIGMGHGSWPTGDTSCGDTSTILRKANGKSVWFPPKQMNAMAVKRVAPPYPPMGRFQGSVVVAVFVNADGRVSCSHFISGHPLVQMACFQAAAKWTFKPLTKKGSRVSFVGLLMFTFKSDGSVTY
jgi:outer membrane biosynthesis protein TonB